MKPKSLSIQGINSFEEEQSIDFEKLGRAGLFGIFGVTGSGKSTILDAITLALYGEIPRYSFTNEKNLAFINCNSQSASVKLCFTLPGEGEPWNYVIERGFRAVRGEGDRFKPSHCRIYRERNGELEVLEDKSSAKVTACVIKLVGLTYDDFIRSAILPQGQFSRFLMLKNSERRNMLARIFKLEEYGEKLRQRFFNYFNELNGRLTALHKAMGGFEGVSEENLAAEEEKADRMALSLLEAKKLAEEYGLAAEKYKTLARNLDELVFWEQKLKAHKEKEKEVREWEERLELARKAERLLPSIGHYKALLSKARDVEKSLAQLEKTAGEKRKEAAILWEEHKRALEEKDGTLPGLLVREKELHDGILLLKEIQVLEEEKGALAKRYGACKAELDKEHRDFIRKGERLEKLSLELSLLEKEKAEAEVKTDYRDFIAQGLALEKETETLNSGISDLFTKTGKLCIQIDEEKGRLQELESRKPGLEKERDRLLTEINRKEADCKERIRIEEEKARAHQKSALDELEKADKEFENLTGEINHLQYAMAAYKLAEGLAPGQGCPVCGSLHHPHLAERSHGDMGALMETREQLGARRKGCSEKLALANSALLYTVSSLNPIKTDFEKERVVYGERLKSLDSRASALEKEMAVIGERLENLVKGQKETEEALHQKKVEKEKLEEDWKKKLETAGISSFKKENDTIRSRDVQKNRLEADEKRIRTELESIRKSREEAGERIGAAQREMEAIKVSGLQKKELLEEKKEKLTALAGSISPEEGLRENKKAMEALTEKEKSLREDMEKARVFAEEASQRYSGALKERDSLSQLVTDSWDKLNKELGENGFGNIEEGEKRVLSPEEMKKIEDGISHYYGGVKESEESVARLTPLLEGEERDSIKEKLSQYTGFLEEARENTSRLEKEHAVAGERIKQMKAALSRLGQLMEEKKELAAKCRLAEELAGVFRGNRFVDFVAKRHLAYIAAEASRRLKKMTGGRYAMELDGADFVFRDDFNGGARRLPSALSGGETFIASLCLALALSAKIQMKSNTTLNFFFLDEGFGSLDPKSLDTVINGLYSLRKENFTVGLISHVEELKTGIMESITVLPPVAGEGGSRIWY